MLRLLNGVRGVQIIGIICGMITLGFIGDKIGRECLASLYDRLACPFFLHAKGCKTRSLHLYWKRLKLQLLMQALLHWKRICNLVQLNDSLSLAQANGVR